MDIICIWSYMLVSDSVHVWFFCVKHAVHFSKMIRYLHKMIFITQTTPSCVVTFKQTIVVSKIRQIKFESLYKWFFPGGDDLHFLYLVLSLSLSDNSSLVANVICLLKPTWNKVYLILSYLISQLKIYHCDGAIYRGGCFAPKGGLLVPKGGRLVPFVQNV